LTDPKQDRFSIEPAEFKSVSLTGRDLEDARRLFQLLSGAGSARASSLPRSLYERIQGDDSRLLHRATQIIALRRRRVQTFGKGMFGEPAWDILLVLYTTGGGLTMNRLAQLAGVSQATGIRWMGYLFDQKLISKQPDPTDARSLRVMLTNKGKSALDAYFSGAVELGDC
jgi:DNA-binding MarR family transcriptional regulator